MGRKRDSRRRPKTTAVGDGSLPASDPDPSPSSGDSRPWADLPEPLLVSILDRLHSVTDVLAFAAACPQWRSAVASSPNPRRWPPLLLSPIVTVRHDGRFVSWCGPRRCGLQSLTLTAKRSPLSSRTLNRPFIGCSLGHLLFLGPSGRHVILASAFSGEELRSPDFPSGPFQMSSGVLTASPSSTSCFLLMAAHNTTSGVYSILCWRPSSGQSARWWELKLKDIVHIMSMVVFKGRVFALDSLYRLVTVEFDPEMSYRVLGAVLPPAEFHYHHGGKFGHHLFECDGKLWAVFFVPAERFILHLDFTLPLGTPRIVVYQLDMENSAWVKKESLGKWCLFMDAVAKSVFACPEPERWGGRSNCVYVVGPGCDGWSVFPIDGEEIDASDDCPLQIRYLKLPIWPSPVWVYPCMLASLGHCH